MMMRKRLRVLQVLVFFFMVLALYQIGSSIYQDRAFDAQQSAFVERYAPDQEDDCQDGSWLTDLQATYPEILGWIRIPGTVIDYPVVQGQDNVFYLDHTISGKPHPYGAIFLEVDNKADFSDQNSILYGHNVPSGKQFHDLINYRHQAYADAYPDIHITTKNGTQDYKIFAAYEAAPYDNFRSPNYTDQEWTIFMDRLLERNLLSYEVPKDLSHFLTLQTCKNDDVRMVVHAYRVTEEE